MDDRTSESGEGPAVDKDVNCLSCGVAKWAHEGDVGHTFSPTPGPDQCRYCVDAAREAEHKRCGFCLLGHPNFCVRTAGGTCTTRPS